MDSNHCSGNKYTDAINELLISGKLTPQEATERLAAAVDKELEKAPEDIRESFIATCEELIYAINNKEAYVSRAESSRKELEARLTKKDKRSSMSKRIAAMSGIAAVLVVGVIIIDGIFRREWFEGTSTPDQQQFEVAGNVIDPGLVDGGHANVAEETREITTADFDEAVQTLGYTPLVPAWIPEGWEIKEYYAFAEEGYSRFSIDMVSSNVDGILTYELVTFDDMGSAIHAFEQNEHGQDTPCNGWNVYITENIQRCASVWRDGNTLYSLFGPIAQDDLLEMINSIERGNTT